MNRSAIDDLLHTTLSRWYESLADWAPPGRLSAATCTSCHRSPLAQHLEVEEWPHDLVHQLVALLGDLHGQVSSSVPDGAARDRALGHLRARIREHSCDVLDVLVECVEPRVQAWVRRELERGLAQERLTS